MDIATFFSGTQVSIQESASFTIAGISLRVAASLMPTVFIIGRIVSIRRRHVQLMGPWQFSSVLYPHSVLPGQSDNTKQYMSIIAMLIESYALDVAATLGQLAFPIVDLLSSPQRIIYGNSRPTYNVLLTSEEFIRVSLPVQQTQSSDDDCAGI
jgi:hypothetical protein